MKRTSTFFISTVALISVFTCFSFSLNSDKLSICNDNLSDLNKVTERGLFDGEINQDSIPSYPAENFNGKPDRSVYIIKNNMHNKVIDINNSNYSEGGNISLYRQHSNENQRFVIAKEYNNDNTLYSIRLLGKETLHIGLSNSNNNLRVLGPKYNNIGSMSETKFYILPATNGNFYIINKNTGNYLVPSNYDTSLSTNSIVSRSITGLTAAVKKNFEWNFIETDSLVIDSYKESVISNGGYAYYNINPSINSKYFITSKNKNAPYSNSNHQIKIYEAGSNLQVGTSVWNPVTKESNITIFLDKQKNYYLKVFNMNNSSALFRVKLHPATENTIVQYGVYDEFQNATDRVTAMTKYNSRLEDKGYIVKTYANVEKGVYRNYTDSEYETFKSKYFVQRGHGGGGAMFGYNGRSAVNQYFGYSNLPNDMTGNRASFWIGCHTATFPSNSFNTLPRRSVQNGSKYSLGYKYSVDTGMANTFSSNLMECLAEGEEFNENTLLKVLSYTATDEYFTALLHPDDTIFFPSLYGRDANNNIILFSYHGLNYMTAKPFTVTYDDGEAKSSQNFVYGKPALQEVNEKIDEFTEMNEQKEFHQEGIGIRTTKDGRKFIIYDDLYTNFEYNESNIKKVSLYYQQNKSRIEHEKTTNTERKFFMFENNDIIKFYSSFYDELNGQFETYDIDGNFYDYETIRMISLD